MANTTATWDEIQQIFSGFDIGIMRMYGYVLDDYDSVVANANTLFGELAQGRMPPSPIQPLSQEQLQLFRSWMQNGFPKSAAAADGLDDFIAMSQFLTGFDDTSVSTGPARAVGVNRAIAQKYLDCLNEWAEMSSSGTGSFYANSDPKEFASLLKTWGDGLEEFENLINTDPGLQSAARAVITIWLTASSVSGFGFGQFTQATGYPDARVWDIFETHPMGYSPHAWRDSKDPKKDHQILKETQHDNGTPYWNLIPTQYETVKK